MQQYSKKKLINEYKHETHGAQRDGRQTTIYIITLLSYQNAFVIPFRMWHNCITITSTIWKLWMLFLLLFQFFMLFYVWFYVLFLLLVIFAHHLLHCLSILISSLTSFQYYVSIHIPFLLPTHTTYYPSLPPHTQKQSLDVYILIKNTFIYPRNIL